MRSIDHQDFSHKVAAIALGCDLHGASQQIEQAVECFIGLDFHDLMGGRMPSHRVFYPPLKPRPTGSLAAVNSGEGRHHRSRPILSRRLPQKDAADACSKMRCSADRERIHVERSLLQPGRVVGDEREHAETDLAALNQKSA